MVAVLEYCTNMDCDFISSSDGRLHLWVGSLVGSEGVQTVCLIRFALSHTLEFLAKFAQVLWAAGVVRLLPPPTLGPLSRRLFVGLERSKKLSPKPTDI